MHRCADVTKCAGHAPVCRRDRMCRACALRTLALIGKYFLYRSSTPCACCSNSRLVLTCDMFMQPRHMQPLTVLVCVSGRRNTIS
eukprot:9470174-Pyramimonas_sp.AAC.1